MSEISRYNPFLTPEENADRGVRIVNGKVEEFKAIPRSVKSDALEGFARTFGIHLVDSPWGRIPEDSARRMMSLRNLYQSAEDVVLNYVTSEMKRAIGCGCSQCVSEGVNIGNWYGLDKLPRKKS